MNLQRFERETVGSPRVEMATHFLHHPPPERNDQPRLLRDGDEQFGADLPVDGMEPAHQRLEAVAGAVLQRHDRLEDDPRAGIAFQIGAQIAGEFRSFDDLLRNTSSKSTTRAPPSSFARYIAMSASRSTLSTVSCNASIATTPTLARDGARPPRP